MGQDFYGPGKPYFGYYGAKDYGGTQSGHAWGEKWGHGGAGDFKGYYDFGPHLAGGTGGK